MPQEEKENFPVDNTHGASGGIVAAFQSAAVHRVPAYGASSGAMREQLDRIIAGNASRDPAHAASFGDEASEEGLRVSTNIIAAMGSEVDGVFRQPIEEVADRLKALNLEDIQKSAAQLMNKGGDLVRNNKGGAAVFVGAVLSGQFWIAAATGGVVAVREHLRASRMEKSPDTPEALSNRIRNALLEATEMQDRLARAEERVPSLLARIDALATVNGKSYYNITAYLSAGQEILRRATEEEIPDLRRKMEENPDYDTEIALREREQYAATLEQKLSILAMSRADAVGGTYVLGDLKKALIDNQLSLRSLRTSELSDYSRAIATSGLGLDSYRTTKVASEVRDHMDSLRRDAAKIADMAQKAALDGRADSPERIQRAIDAIESFRTRVEKMQENQHALDALRNMKLQRLGMSVADLLQAQANTLLEQQQAPNLPSRQP